MRVIGLTGGIASGKSAVADMLALPHIDADQVSRQVVAPGSPGLQAVVDAFGTDVLQPDGQLDRAAVRRRIATNHDDQARLNAILHPLIGEAIQQQIAELAAAGHEAAVVSAALMMESGSYERYDAVVLVTAPKAVRLQRLIDRDGMDEATARQLMAKQWSDDRKRPLADVEIVNDGDLDQLRSRTREAAATLNLPVVD